MHEEKFEELLNPLEKAAWQVFKNVIHSFGGNLKAENYSDIVHDLITSYKKLCCNKGCSFRGNLVALHFKYDQGRRRFVEWAQNEIAVVPDFHKRILFSDEAHFCLSGYVNKQNCRIWSEANPQVYVETPLHPEKLTVWCALWAGGILLQKR
ncbi:transposable element Tc3 transposase [Trichonephila clavipes]|uniref:Transposable element Tc3 transposase n=1 Tax=Trichonephila clavipes TaxID=2585209 RepID=A0A8X7BKY6_TRICX|nr:transposable element Tc3 transposase [Trichonephila clavipes]